MGVRKERVKEKGMGHKGGEERRGEDDERKMIPCIKEYKIKIP